MKKIIPFIIMTGLLSCGENESCKCIEEFDSLRVNSKRYNLCLDMAIYDNAGDDPYEYHQRKCDD